MISAYKDITNLVDVLPTLKFSGTSEIIVAADCIPLSDKKRLEKLGAIVDYSKTRRGKVVALNHAEDMAKGELLVFLDSDTNPRSKNFLDTIWKHYSEKQFDVANGRIGIKRGKKLQAMVHIDYLFMNTVFSTAQLFKEVPPLMGAFFVIKKACFEQLGKFSRVVVEDVDLGYKAATEGMKFHLMKDIYVETAAPDSFKEWIKQRRRWVSGFLSTAFSQKKQVMKKAPFSFTSLFAFYPIPMSSLAWTLFLASFASQITIFGVLLASFLSTSGALWFLNKSLNWGISLRAALAYILAYGPLWSIFTIYMLLSAPFSNKKVEDWVV